jgi:hypothetical protein
VLDFSRDLPTDDHSSVNSDEPLYYFLLATFLVFAAGIMALIFIRKQPFVTPDLRNQIELTTLHPQVLNDDSHEAESDLLMQSTSAIMEEVAPREVMPKGS